MLRIVNPGSDWPADADALIAEQDVLVGHARAALDWSPWSLTRDARFGGCFLAYAAGEAGPGRPGDRAWAAAVVWRPRGGTPRRTDAMLRGPAHRGPPRRATDVEDQAVVEGRTGASYAPGLLALREGPLLAAAVDALCAPPDVLLVDASGLDHPRGAGLAVHLGYLMSLPTVGVTRRPLVGRGEEPPLVRGRSSPVLVDDQVVARWVCTRTGARPILAHAAWRTDADTAAAVVLATSTEGARTPVPLQEARRVAREMRAISEVRR